MATGDHWVTLEVEARKTRADSVGRETDVPMDDLIEIGVFAADSGGVRGDPLYLKWHRIRTGRQTISVTVPTEPARGSIDPYHRLIDRDGRDNVVAPIVRGTGSRPGGP